MKATLSSFSMEKFTSLKSRVPSIDFASPLTSRILLPGSRDGVKMIPGYRREEGCISSILSFSSIFLRLVVCFDLATLALNLWINSSNSFRFSSAFFVLLLLLTQSQLAGFVPETVIPGEKLYFAEVDIYGVRTYRIEEVPVVRNDQYGISKLAR